MDSCSGDFLYEYNTICYRKCPPGTKVIENQYLCEGTIIEDEIIHTTNEVLETIELSYENDEEENKEIETNEEEGKDNMQEINEKEKIKISDINTYENEKITNIVENNEEKANKDTNNNNENEDYKGTKVAIISIGISICVVVIVTLAIICFIRKIEIRNINIPVVSSVNSAVSSNSDNQNNMIEEPKENKIQQNPINIYNVHFQFAYPEVENSKDSIKFNIIKDLNEIKN